MKLMVTGGAGFIGSAVIRQALNENHQVLNIDCLTYASCLDNLKDVACNPCYQFSKIDIRAYKELEEIVFCFQPDAIMHLAAESHVDRSIDAPSIFIETNILGTFNLLEASRKYWREAGEKSNFRFHHVSTDEVFGSLRINKSEKFLETTPYNPTSPYSASKASSDHLVRAWHETYGLPVLISNCSNNYGPYQFPEKLIPVIIINALSNKPLPIYGIGNNVRDWLFVEDHADALLQVLLYGKCGRSYNIGGENERTNLEMVQTLCAILDKLKPRTHGHYADLITFTEDRPGHDQRYAIDPSRIRDEIGWRPSVTVEQGLEKTVKWYLENEEWWKEIIQKKESSLNE